MQENRRVKRDPNSVGVKADLIQFRSSPNFKNMKKFLKNRSDYELASTSMSSPNINMEPEVQEEVENEVEVKPNVFQPPLPTYPPPDSLPNLNIVIKKERVDVVEDPEESKVEASIKFEKMSTAAPQQPTIGDKKTKRTMCKEFIRGECNRTMCRYSHELDLNQLYGVFTFCWNYQNKRCTHPSCKFVHATIFEEAEFYRTGFLPARTRRHLKKLPPPSPPPKVKNVVNGPRNNLMNPLPNIRPEQQAPMINSSKEEKPEDFLAKTSTPLKLSSLPRDLDHNDHLAKKCNDCDLMEFRLQYKKEKVEDLIRSNEETDKEINMLDKKCKKLATILFTILKPASMGNNSKLGLENMVGDKAKMEHFINRSFANNDNFKNTYGSNTNLQALWSKLFCKTEDQSLPADQSLPTDARDS